MRWESSDHRRSAGSQGLALRLPVPLRVVVGALAIAAIVLAVVMRPSQSAQEPQQAAPLAKPTVAAAAIVPLPTVVPPSQTAAPTASAGASGARIHEVVQGDTLSSIAKKYYNDASKWNKILDANRDILKNADTLKLGQKLKIPE